MGTEETATYTEGEIEGQSKTPEVNKGEGESFLRYKMFDMVDWPDENREARSPGQHKMRCEEGKKQQTRTSQVNSLS